MTRLASLLFILGLGFFLISLFVVFPFAEAPMIVGGTIAMQAPAETGAANVVTSVVLGYRGIDTLGEIAILFSAATAAGLVLGRREVSRAVVNAPGGDVLKTGADLLFPLLLMVGAYIIVHGHLTPGGGFQGGVILAAAFFVPVLARPSSLPRHGLIGLIEGTAGAAFIVIGLLGLWYGHAFMQPFLDKGIMGGLLSAGTLPWLYLALGLKVGAELAGLLAHLALDAPVTGDAD
ncbi:MAG: MnhB domain-containing protein [Gammaproteobacteria bacterium]